MNYDIHLRISHKYANPAGGGRHLLRLMPADLPGEQRLVAGQIDISPRPDERQDRSDFFGNRLVEFAFHDPYDRVSLSLQARVNRLPAPSPDRNPTPLHRLSDEIAAHSDLSPHSPAHFRQSSPRVQLTPDMTSYAKGQLSAGMSATDAVLAVGHALHRDMTFDAKATEVDTPPAEAFAQRQGVCQDFSHIMIACLRGIGIPAAYVSGFLRTRPPPGKARLEGADAMHAWVRAWSGAATGWLEFDPTNAVIAGSDHIVVASGRDYFDVVPVKGVMRASGRQKSSQSVDVIPVA